MSRAADDPRTLEIAANTHFQRGRWSEAESSYLELLSAVDSQAKPSANSERLRLRCWSQLEQIARQTNRPNDALRFAMKARAALPKSADDDLRSLHSFRIAEYQLALDEDSEARATLSELLAGRFGPLKTLPKLRTQYLLGVVEHRASHVDAARTNWQLAEQSITALFDRHQKTPFLTPADRLDLSQRRIAICEAQQRDEAIKRTEELIAWLTPSSGSSEKTADEARNDLSKFIGRLGLARHARLRRDSIHAERHLTAALEQTQRVPLHEQASALRLLATVLEDRDPAHARDTWLRVARTLDSSDNSAIASASDLRWVIEGYSRANRVAEAIRHAERWLAHEEAEHGTSHRRTLTAITTLAELKARNGELTDAEQLLRRSLAAYQTAKLPREQFRSLLQLASVRRSLGDLADAERLLRAAIDISDQQLPADDPDRPLARRQLAALLPSAGRFREAIALNQQILDEAQQRGSSGDRLRAEVLLNLAIIDRNQGLAESAADKAQQAASLWEASLGHDAWPLVATHNVLSAIARDQGQVDEAVAHAQAALRLCDQHGKPHDPEAAVAYQQLGSLAAQRNELATAMTNWKAASSIYRSRGQSSREAHILSLIGGVALKATDRELAASALDHAERLLRDRAASPLDRYVILANQAVRYAQDGDLPEAIRLLQQGIDIAESARTETAGNAEAGRARFFAQFAPAFERLIDWHLQSGHTAEAFLAAEQSRSRTLLDQLQLAGLDLKTTLPHEIQRRLLPQEQLLAQQQQQLRQSLVSARDADDDMLAQRQQTLDQKEREYSKVWQAIRDASPLYNQLLAGRDSLCGLSRVQREVLPPDTLMLFYQLGSQNSSVWIIGRDPETVEVVPLRIGHTLPALQFREATSQPTRGIVGRLAVDKGLLRRGLAPISPGPVTRDIASRLVTWYLAATVPFTPSGTRGLAGTVATVKGEAISPSSLTLVADTLLPPAVREAVQRRQPKSIVIVPDAALHQLPFEALLLSAGPRPQYVLDEWPPIIYSPSATVLAQLAVRSELAATRERRLLIVGHSPADSAVSSPLPGVVAECRRIATKWPKEMTSLLDKEAREAAVVRHLPTHRIVHFATHGFVDEQSDNLFGGLLLAPDANGDDTLSYLDIVRTNLTGCELAVLSACQTSVGPERPMEASTSLAQAFLAAGAHQVVASLWHVSDESTAELMSNFYDRIGQDVSEGRRLRVAESLHAAKRHLRASSEWNSPAHWASFVFIGPAQ